MSATADQIAQLRRMVAEPTETTYTDELVAAIIERYPMLDDDGRAPGDTDYDGGYNLNLAAADILEEKAAGVADAYDYSNGAGKFQQSQEAARYLELAQMFRNKRVKGARLLP